MNKKIDTQHIPLHAPISKEIFQAYTKLMESVSHLPDKQFREKRLEGTGGLISIADLLAYQIGWGSLVIQWYESGIHNQPMIMPGDGFSKWDYTAIAKYFYQKYALLNPIELKAIFHSTVERLIDITECEFVSGRLDQLGVWCWCRLQSGKEWPLSKWIQINTVAPYKRAMTMIKKGQGPMDLAL